MTLLKECVGVEVVRRVTGAATIDGELAFLGCTEDIRVSDRFGAIGARETLWVEMVQNPLRAFGWAEQIGDWKFHAT
jgi:hypothetical protein